MKHPRYLAVAAAAATAMFIPAAALGAPATSTSLTSNLSRAAADTNRDKAAEEKAAAEAELARVTADLAAEKAKVPSLEEDLAAALREGKIAGAGLDVTATEPLPADSPLWDLATIITPHTAGGRPVGAEELILANVRALRDGGEFINREA